MIQDRGLRLSFETDDGTEDVLEGLRACVLYLSFGDTFPLYILLAPYPRFPKLSPPQISENCLSES